MNAREVLSKHSGETVNDLYKYRSVQIIRPWEAIDAMEDFASQKTKDMFTKEQVIEIIYNAIHQIDLSVSDCENDDRLIIEKWLEQENPLDSIQKDENKDQIKES